MTSDREPIIDESMFARSEESKPRPPLSGKQNGIRSPWFKFVRIGERPARFDIDENGFPSVTVLPNYLAFPPGLEKHIKDVSALVNLNALRVTNPETLAPVPQQPDIEASEE